MKNSKMRVERDSLGEVRVPAAALWGAQTQRAVENFPLSGTRMPPRFIRALAAIKEAAARVHGELGLLDPRTAEAVANAAAEIAAGGHDDQFPVDVFQTGSGTSTNMNVNEVIARLATDRLGAAVHPHDHVNLGQSSNDTIPAALHIAAAEAIDEKLLPALEHLEGVLRDRAEELAEVVKTGRTHLMDALPVTLAQEIGGWATLVSNARERITSSRPRLLALPLGGTAVGTGVNAHPEFAARITERLARMTGLAFVSVADRFAALGTPDAAVEMSGQLRAAAGSVLKIAHDLRWMNSGPGAGLGEITLPALQPGSSIMPAKVNPVIPEAVAMVCARITGLDATIAIAGASGNFQLNTMLPLIAHELLEEIELLACASTLLADRAVAGFTVNRDRIEDRLSRNPILVTALNPVIGYEKSAAIAKRAQREDRALLEIALEETDLSREELERLLDPARLTRGGFPS